MESALLISLVLTIASLLSWVWLILGRGFYWRADEDLESIISTFPIEDSDSNLWPDVTVIIPARNETKMLPLTLPSLVGQDYPGQIRVILVDDESTDNTLETTRILANRLNSIAASNHRLNVVEGQELPAGWTSKLWALEQGIRASTSAGESFNAKYFLFTDADIVHPSTNLKNLVRHAQDNNLGLVSVMAHLHVVSIWDRLLIPAFVYFFAKLFPFRWVNNPQKSTAAAAGGCMLVRRESLEMAGGLDRVKGEIIDDCAIARMIKNSTEQSQRKIWIGYNRSVRSLRNYQGDWETFGKWLPAPHSPNCGSHHCCLY